jgi:hypothetical protein
MGRRESLLEADSSCQSLSPCESDASTIVPKECAPIITVGGHHAYNVTHAQSCACARAACMHYEGRTTADLSVGGEEQARVGPHGGHHSMLRAHNLCQPVLFDRAADEVG